MAKRARATMSHKIYTGYKPMTSVTASTMYDEMLKQATASTEYEIHSPTVEAPEPALEALSTIEDEFFDLVPFSELVKNSGNLYTTFDFNTKEYPDFHVQVYKDKYWEAEALDMVPTVPKTYLFPTEYLYHVLLAWAHNDRTLVFGPPGTGKTTLVQMASAITNRPYIRINGRKDIESSNIFGSMDFDGEKTVWRDGDLAIAAKLGATVNVDEPFLIPPDIGMGMNPILEKDGVVKLQDKVGAAEDRIIVPRESFRVVYSDNTGGNGDVTGEYAGVDVQNSSTLDRFSTAINMQYLANDDEVNMVSEGTTLGKATVERMVRVANLVRTAYSKNELSITMSPRTLFSWAKKTEHYKDVHRAFVTCFTNKISEVSDVTAVRQIVKTVFGSKSL